MARFGSKMISPELLKVLEPHWRCVIDERGHDVPLQAVGQLNSWGEAPIHIAAWKGTAAAVTWLVENGANVEQRGAHGMTPLHYAYMGGDSDIIEVLLTAGADPNARTHMGLLPGAGSIAEGLRAERDRW